ncbi:unnamed protein product [Rotaria socialis]
MDQSKHWTVILLVLIAYDKLHTLLSMLRLGTENDFDALYPIYMHPTVNPYLNFEMMSKEEFLPLFHELITSGTLYVYENDDGQVAATCIVCRSQRRFSHVICLTTFATNPKFQRKGFGTKLIQKLIEELTKDERIKRIELYAEVDNEIGLNFYKKLGFQVEGCLRKSYKRMQDDHPIDELVLAMVFD